MRPRGGSGCRHLRGGINDAPNGAEEDAEDMKRYQGKLSFFKIFALAAAMFAVLSPSGAAEGVAPIRLERLSRGVNASHWFAQVYDAKGYSVEHFRTFMKPEDMDLIAKSGLKHVRLSVEPEGLFRPDKPDALQPERLAELDRAIRMILDHRLAVIVDIHTYGGFLDRLADDDAHLAAVAKFWESLAGHLKRYDPDWLYLELLNEPQLRDGARWQTVLETLAAAARRGAPEHTLLLSGKAYSGIPELLELKPLADRNAVYVFHFYEPGVFTHQGATWSYPPWKDLRALPYPADPEILAASDASADGGEARKELERYGGERWNANRIASLIQSAADWARKHDVPLICDEFGVYAEFAPPESRLRWIADVRKTLERAGIGWTMWDYAGGFRLVRPRAEGELRLDDGIAEALGLTPLETSVGDD